MSLDALIDEYRCTLQHLNERERSHQSSLDCAHGALSDLNANFAERALLWRNGLCCLDHGLVRAIDRPMIFLLAARPKSTRQLLVDGQKGFIAVLGQLPGACPASMVQR